MDLGLTSFMKKSKGLAKNPLGIIALFISLIYGFACLVLSTTLDNLKTNYERIPLIWFIIVFPILILWAFVYLVKNHHEKLYAPSDFKNEDNFLKSMDKNSQTEKINAEIKTIVEDKEEILKNTNAAPKELSHEDISSLKQNYLLAEDLALKEFEFRHEVTLNRNQKLKVGNSGKSFEFDGVGEGNKGGLFLVEIKFASLNYLSTRLRKRIKDFVTDIINNEALLSHGMIDLKPSIVIVSENDNNLALERELKELVSSFDLPVIGEVYSFNELKISYGLA